MSGLPWVKWYAADFLNGIADLEPNEIAVYTVVLMRIYDEGGPIPDEPAKIARRCNMRPTSCEKALAALSESGKLTRSDGHITNARCEIEIESRRKVSEKSSKSATSRWKNTPEKPNEINDDAMRTQCVGNAIQKPDIEVEVEVPTDVGTLTPSLRSGVHQTRRKGWPAGAFEQFWERYPRKVGKGTARKAFDKLAGAVEITTLLSALDAYRASKPPDVDFCHPTTWLNGERWSDVWDEEPALIAAPAIPAGLPSPDELRLKYTRLMEEKRNVAASEEATAPAGHRDPDRRNDVQAVPDRRPALHQVDEGGRPGPMLPDHFREPGVAGVERLVHAPRR